MFEVMLGVRKEEPVEDGFLGEVNGIDFITSSDLITKIGLTAGTAINQDSPWLKFILDGKILYVAKKPLKHNISWNQINATGCVTGTSPILIEGVAYKVRLLKTSLRDPTFNGGHGADYVDTHGSEWNRLMYRVCLGLQDDVFSSVVGAPGNWAQYTASQLGVSSDESGCFNLMQETHGLSQTYCTVRGFGGQPEIQSVSYFGYTTKTEASSRLGWRPVLELV